MRQPFRSLAVAACLLLHGPGAHRRRKHPTSPDVQETGDHSQFISHRCHDHPPVKTGLAGPIVDQAYRVASFRFPPTDCCLDCAPGALGARSAALTPGGKVQSSGEGNRGVRIARLPWLSPRYRSWPGTLLTIRYCEPATDPSTVLVHDASGVSVWECFAEAAPGPVTANFCGRDPLRPRPEFALRRRDGMRRVPARSR